MKRGTDCAAHVHWTTVPLEDHHIFPREYGGTSAPGNIARVCSNAHGNIHYYIALLIKHIGAVPWDVARTFGKKERQLAKKGYEQILKLPAREFADAGRHAVSLLEDGDAA